MGENRKDGFRDGQFKKTLVRDGYLQMRGKLWKNTKTGGQLQRIDILKWRCIN